MINKTPMGLGFFDAELGGVYRGRPFLCTGRAKSGKTVLAFHFIDAGLKCDEKVLVLSDSIVQNELINSSAFGFNFDSAIRTEQLSVLEFSPLYETEENSCLSPEAFLEFQEIVETNGISRVVFDSVLPWLAVKPVEKLPKHIYSFVHALDRLNVTTFMSLPKPKSNAAFVLRKTLKQHCPIEIILDRPDETRYTFRVAKYLGHTKTEFAERDVTLMPGQGIVLAEPPPGMMTQDEDAMHDEETASYFPVPRSPLNAARQRTTAPGRVPQPPPPPQWAMQQEEEMQQEYEQAASRAPVREMPKKVLPQYQSNHGNQYTPQQPAYPQREYKKNRPRFSDVINH